VSPVAASRQAGAPAASPRSGVAFGSAPPPRATRDLEEAFFRGQSDNLCVLLTLVEARNVPQRSGRETGLFCTIGASGQPLLSTSIVKDSQHPMWNADIPLTLHRRPDLTLKVSLLRFVGGGKDSLVSEVVFAAPQIEKFDRWVKMTPIEKCQPPPEIHLKIDILPQSALSPGKSTK
jgi:hypothetical protein